MWIVLLLVTGIGFGLLASLALHPVRTLVTIVRILLFLIAVCLVVAYFTVGQDIREDSQREVLVWIVAAFGAWALTYIVPGAIGLLAPSRSDK